MTLQFYQVSDDPRVVRKNLGAVTQVASVFLKDARDVTSPVFILQGDFKQGKGNYCYCPELQRYYFINDITIDVGNKAAFSCSEDVLMTYADAIMNTDVVTFIQGADALADNLIADERIPMQVNTTSRTHNFKNSQLKSVNTGNWCFVLNCYGGGTKTT